MSRRSNRKKHLCPPLIFLDKAIYAIGFVLIVSCAFLLIFGLEDIKLWIAYQNADVVAYHGSSTALWALPFILFLVTSAITLLLAGWEMRKPIFGSKKYTYGVAPYEKCIPVFHRKGLIPPTTPNKKRFIRKCVSVWLVLLLLTVCLIPFSLFGRSVMDRDSRIQVYNMWNVQHHTYSSEQYVQLTIKADRHVAGSARSLRYYWEYEITIRTDDGKKFWFSTYDLNWRFADAREAWLDQMLEVKNTLDPDIITIQGQENVDRVADWIGLSEQQRVKAHELFAAPTTAT